MTKTEVTQLSYEIVACGIKVHKTLGPGLLETVYEKCLKFELEKKGFDVKNQFTIEVKYESLTISTALRVDLLVNDIIVIELKTVDKLLPVHEAQLLTYMKLLEKPQGLLINFFTDNITKSLKPLVNKVFKDLKD